MKQLWGIGLGGMASVVVICLAAKTGSDMAHGRPLSGASRITGMIAIAIVVAFANWVLRPTRRN